MLLYMMQLYIPGFIKRGKLEGLFYLTADAFQAELPELKGLSFAKCLSKYAYFVTLSSSDFRKGSLSGKITDCRLFLLFL
ncbi:MAG: hypothetical protein GX354_05905 [Firmicutes bacterium]|jgi:hypothetical protein|nr:hypothetical protein [Bacillota bacterium]